MKWILLLSLVAIKVECCENYYIKAECLEQAVEACKIQLNWGRYDPELQKCKKSESGEASCLNLSQKACQNQPDLRCVLLGTKCKYTNSINCSEAVTQKICEAVTTYTCDWDQTKNKCQFLYQSLNQKSCKMLPVPTKFTNICQEVIDGSELICSEKGLNQKACMLVRNYSCVWENEQCQFYFVANNDCASTKANVNERTCQEVLSSLCKYDPDKQQCQAMDEKNFLEKQCNSPGLNLQACIKISNCVFHSSEQKYGCMRQSEDMLCPLKAIAVNKNACLDSLDSCVYIPFLNACMKGSANDECSPNLNKVACLEAKGCDFFNGECQCNIFGLSPAKCEDAINPQSNQECQKRIQNCYLSYDKTCKTAESCQNVTISTSMLCSDVVIEKEKCIFLSKNDVQRTIQCGKMDCKIFDYENCIQHADHCMWVANQKECNFKGCANIYNQDLCEVHRNFCTYDPVGKTCLQISYCDDISLQKYSQYGWDSDSWLIFCAQAHAFLQYSSLPNQAASGVKCFPKQQGSEFVCSDNPCSTILGICEGMRLRESICVKDWEKGQCTACESLSTICACKDFPDHCQWNWREKRCKSKLCEILGETDCKSQRGCLWVNATCQTQCERYPTQLACQHNQDSQCSLDITTGRYNCVQAFQCFWKEQDQMCHYCNEDELDCSDKKHCTDQQNICCKKVEEECRVNCASLGESQCGRGKTENYCHKTISVSNGLKIQCSDRPKPDVIQVSPPKASKGLIHFVEIMLALILG